MQDSVKLTSTDSMIAFVISLEFCHLSIPGYIVTQSVAPKTNYPMCDSPIDTTISVVLIIKAIKGRP